VLRFLAALLLLMNFSVAAEAGSPFSGFPSASQPLGNVPTYVPMDQGTDCKASSPVSCSTVQSDALRLGQPIQTNCSTIVSPFQYQECDDTSQSPPVLKQYIGTTWWPLWTLDPSAGPVFHPGIVVGTTAVQSGTNGYALYDNNGTLGNATIPTLLGYTPLNPANNLSELTNAATARTNLGLGSMATQNASAVTITGGTINGTMIGNGTPSTGVFTSITGTGITVTGASSLSSVITGTAYFAGSTSQPLSANLLTVYDTVNSGVALETGLAIGCHYNNNGLGGGSGTILGARNCLYSVASFDAPSNAANAIPNFTPFTAFMLVASNNGGTSSGTATGSFYGGASDVNTNFGSTGKWLSAVESWEANYGLASGDNANILAGIIIAPDANHFTRGTNDDAGLEITNQSSHQTMAIAIELSNISGHQPLGSDGVVMKTTGSGTITDGINFASYTISGNAFHWAHGSLGGSGNIQGDGYGAIGGSAISTVGWYAYGPSAASSAALIAQGFDQTGTRYALIAKDSAGNNLLLVANNGAISIGAAGLANCNPLKTVGGVLTCGP
jgi:hypothetical protein